MSAPRYCREPGCLVVPAAPWPMCKRHWRALSRAQRRALRAEKWPKTTPGPGDMACAGVEQEGAV